jgi:small subunit ribosomal protein S11
MGDKAVLIGVKDCDVLIRGVGAGRESALRSFAGKGITITKITDDTPVPHNGPRPPKPRRV